MWLWDLATSALYILCLYFILLVCFYGIVSTVLDPEWLKKWWFADNNGHAVQDDNQPLKQRIAELEAKVDSQNGELLVLRASIAEILRRVSKLEGTEPDADISSKTTPKIPPYLPSSRKSSLSNMSSTTTSERPKSRPQSMYGAPDANEEQTFRPLSSLVNVSLGKSARGSPMRKWLSSYDMKDPSGAPPEAEEPVAGTPKRFRVKVLPKRVASLKANASHPLNSFQSPAGFSPLSRKLSSNSINKNASTQSLANSTINSIPTSQTVSRGLSSRSPSYAALSGSRLLKNSPSREPQFNPSTHILHASVSGRLVGIPVPDAVAEWDLHTTQPPPPGNPPQLEWVYGSSIGATRSSLHHLPSGDIIYPAGTLVVLYHPQEHTQRHYAQHTSDVRTIALHPNRRIVASGQSSRHARNRGTLGNKPPVSPPADSDRAAETKQTQAHIRVWDTVSLTTLSVIGTADHWFERAISALAFSLADGGAFLACVDDSYQHMLSVWDWNKKKKIAETKSTSDTVAISFHPYQNNSIVQYGKNHLYFWTLDPKNEKVQQVPALFEGRDRPKSIQSLCFIDQTTAIVGDSNGSLSQWDIKTGKVLRVLQNLCPGGITALATVSRDKIAAGGAQNQLIIIDAASFMKSEIIQLPEQCKNMRSLKGCRDGAILVGTLENAIYHGTSHGGFQLAVEGVDDEIGATCLHPHTPRLLVVSGSGMAQVWDIEQKRAIWGKHFEDGLTSCSFSHCGSHIALGTESGRLLVVDSNSRNVIFESKYSTQPVLACRFSPATNILAVSTREPSVLILRGSATKTYSSHARIATLPSPVQTIDFSIDGSLIRLTTSMGHLLYYTIEGDSMGAAETRNVEWSTGSCLASYQIAVAASVTSSVTCGELSSEDNGLAALGRGDGTIRIFTSPVHSCEAGYHEIRAGASPILQLHYRNTQLYSTAQGSGTVLQWR